MTHPLKFKVPVFYPLQDLALAWDCSESLLRVYAEHGLANGAGNLELREFDLGGSKVLGVSHEEKARFEALIAGSSPKHARMHSAERQSLVGLVGAISILWCGGDEKYVDHPYALVADIEEAAARNGVPMIRGDDTNAKLLAEAIALMRIKGYPQARISALPAADTGRTEEVAA